MLRQTINFTRFIASLICTIISASSFGIWLMVADELQNHTYSCYQWPFTLNVGCLTFAVSWEYDFIAIVVSVVAMLIFTAAAIFQYSQLMLEMERKGLLRLKEIPQ